MSVRVRYAPSPTGKLHVGNLRAALFDFLMARKSGGQCILRIEDTDRTRYSAEAEDYQYAALKWVGVEFDEGPHIGGPCGPYRQSERKEAGIYEPHIKKLLDEGFAYKAFDTSQELDEMREYQQVNRQPIGYFGGVWRDATSGAVEAAENAGKPFVIRLRMPKNEKIVLDDMVRGRIEWDSNDVDDPVLIKADGMPTYHFAAMVDDHLMDISHVIRGEEWISSAPKHVQLLDCLGWSRPIFVHCPVIKGKDGKKLSKRHGSTSVLDYKYLGFLPHSLLNFIALIGWSPTGDRELLSPSELIEAWDLDRIQPSPGVFDYDKLKWMNGHYLRQTDASDLTKIVREYLSDPETIGFYEAEDEEMPHGDLAPGLELLKSSLVAKPDLAARAIELEQQRVLTLAEFGEATRFFFEEAPEFDSKAIDKWFGQEHVKPMISGFTDLVEGKTAMSIEECEAMIRGYAEGNGLEKLGPVVHPVRVALTGKTVGPGLFELMSALGPAEMGKRFLRAMTLMP